MGGGGAWANGAILHDIWAGIGPVAAWYAPTPAPPDEWLKGIPIYCLYGEADQSVPVARSRLALERMKAIGHKVRVIEKLQDFADIGDETMVYREVPGGQHNLLIPCDRKEKNMDWKKIAAGLFICGSMTACAGGSCVQPAAAPAPSAQNPAPPTTQPAQPAGPATSESSADEKMEKAARLMNLTLPDVAKIDGLNAKKPILFGYSAGGQVALEMWAQNPAGYGGFILDAAYPFVQKVVDNKSVMSLLEPPTTDAGKALIRESPVFALIGENDPGLRLWRQMGPKWRAAGIAVTLHIVPNQSHTWLFGPKQVELLTAWLDAAAKGERPSNIEPGAADVIPAD